MTIMEAAASAIAHRWLAAVPGGPWLADSMSPVLGALLRNAMAVSLPQGTDPDRHTRSMFSVPSHRVTEQDAGAYVANVLLSWLPPEVSMTFGNRPASQPNGEPERPQGVAFDELLRQLRADPDHAPKADELAPVGTAIQSVAVSGATRTWTAELVLEHMKKLVERLARASPRGTRLLTEFGTELEALPLRWAIGKAVGSIQLVPGTVASNEQWGREVHKILQERYRNGRAAHTVVTERTVYSPEWPQGQGLIKAAAATASRYADFTILQQSRFSIFSATGNLRDDLIDFYFGTPQGLSWEIKPIKSAANGVLQECWYRFSYNAWSIWYEDALGLRVRTRRLEAGPDLGLFPPPGLLAPFQVPSAPAVVAFPFCLDELPGLVLYTLVKLPTLLELAPMLVWLADAMRRRLLELKDALEDLAEEVAEQLEEAAKAVQRIAEAFLILAIAIVLVLLIALVIKGLPVLVPAVALGALLVFVVSPASQDEQNQPQSATSRPVTIQIGPCRLQNIPLNQLKGILAPIVPRLDQCAKLAIQQLSSPPAVA